MYEIGQVARITGLSQHQLRAWEKRYDISATARSESGRRLYDQATVERIKRLKQCSQLGYRLGYLTTLSDEKLNNLLDDHLHNQPSNDLTNHTNNNASETIPVSADAPATATLTVLLINIDHQQVQSHIKDVPAFNKVILKSLPTDFSEAISMATQALAENQLDTGISHHYVIAANIETLQPEHVEKCASLRLHQTPFLLCYHFGQRALQSKMQKLGAKLRKGPCQFSWINDLIQQHPAAKTVNASASTAQVHPPEKIFTREILQHLNQMAPNLNCECPNHLSELLLKLRAFESYSQQCGSTSAEDAALHQQIQKTTAQASHLLENLLVDVLKFEKIELESIANATRSNERESVLTFEKARTESTDARKKQE